MHVSSHKISPHSHEFLGPSTEFDKAADALTFSNVRIKNGKASDLEIYIAKPQHQKSSHLKW